MNYINESLKLQNAALQTIRLSLVGMGVNKAEFDIDDETWVVTERGGVVRLNGLGFGLDGRFIQLMHAADVLLEMFYDKSTGTDAPLNLSDEFKDRVRSLHAGFGGVFVNPMRKKKLMVVYAAGDESEMFLDELAWQGLPVNEVAMQFVFDEIAREGLSITDSVALYNECLAERVDPAQEDALQFDLSDRGGLERIVCTRFAEFAIRTGLSSNLATAKP